jgi:tetratricopeptide (TPR) repeat protein
MRLRCLLLAVTLLSLSAGALAQPAPTPTEADRTEEAKGLFAAGRAAFDAGRYEDALDYFQRSHAMSGRPALLYNIALANDRLRNDEKALEGYEAYLAAVPDAPNRADVETRAAAIRAALARREPAPPSAEVPAPAEVAASAEPAAPASAEAAPAPAQAMRDEPAEPREGGGVLSKWWFWTAVGVVVAGGATAIAIAASGEDDPKPLAPRSGVVVTTLQVSP